MVVTQYLKRQPKSKLKNYLPELKRLSELPFGDAGRDDTCGLKGYAKAWKKAACEDGDFIQTQLDVGHAMYMKPALKYAASVGIKSNLGKALIYGKHQIIGCIVTAKPSKCMCFTDPKPFVCRYHYPTWLAGKFRLNGFFFHNQYEFAHGKETDFPFHTTQQYVEPDINLPRILELTGPMGANETEKEYLTRFLTTRRQLVCCYPGDVW